MSNQRLEYLDILKGFAIFLMVMGHFLSWTFAPDANPPVGAMFVRNLIYAFHMPLFFFVSGFLMHLKKDDGYDFSFCGILIKKRMRCLILPGFSFMILTYFRTDTIYFEWFLRTLFELYMVFCLAKFIAHVFNNRIVLELFFQVLIIVVLFVCKKGFDGSLLDKIIDFSNLAHQYPYFLLGFYFRKFDIEKFLKKSDLLYTFCIIGFLVLFFVSNQMGLLHTKYTQYLTATFGIIVCYKIALMIDFSKAGIITHSLLKWGKNTIEIYLLSALLIPYFPALGDLFISSDAYLKMGGLVQNPLHLTSIFLQIVTGVGVGIYVCVVCMVIKKIVEKSRFLNFVLFGK